MSPYWSELVTRLSPYVPGEQPVGHKLVKLNTNENPYGPSPRVLEAIASTPPDSLRRYPDPESAALKQAFATRVGLSSDQVFVGNGSDEVLAHAFQALLKHDAPLLFPDISYSFYPVWCDLYGIKQETIPVQSDFSIAVEDYARPNGGILIPNPNAPTGVLLALAEIRVLLEQSPDSVVVIDEAYVDFGGESAVALISEFENLLVVQTLSKSRALAGMRVGVAMGHPALIEALERVKNSFNSYPLDVVAQRAAVAALEDEAYFRESCGKVIASRQRLSDELVALGFEVLPSAANFLFVRNPAHSAEALFLGLRERKVIVRYFNKPRISEYLRISIGTDADCTALRDALQDMLA